ncbi:hypothetical protein P9747_33000, partial [Paenibacillus macerans]|nr:hypothetical protein [Paenibacillus macerans]
MFRISGFRWRPGRSWNWRFGWSSAANASCCFWRFICWRSRFWTPLLPNYLWSNVAWLVFAGLGWLASWHFYEYRLKYPQGWQRLRRQPIKVAINIALVFACVLLIGISMPAVSPTLTDPYTAWIKRSGGAGGDAGTTLAGAVETTGTALSQEQIMSGYSRDDKDLGDGFEFSYTPVMSVSTPVRSYWRGETRRIYSGKGWA